MVFSCPTEKWGTEKSDRDINSRIASWWFFLVLCSSWWFLVVPGGSLLFLAVNVSSLWFLVVLGGF